MRRQHPPVRDRDRQRRCDHDDERAPSLDHQRAHADEEQVLDVEQRRRRAKQAAGERPLPIGAPQRQRERGERGRVALDVAARRQRAPRRGEAGGAAQAAASLAQRRRATDESVSPASAAAAALTTRAGHNSATGRVAPTSRATSPMSGTYPRCPG